MALFSMLGAACNQSSQAADQLPKAQAEHPADKQAKAGETRTAVFAGGCFWCVEGVFEQLEGVTDATSGYAGDTKDKADYKTVCSGTTKHAEAVRVTYDPAKITFGELLRVFFTTHDPTTKDQQGADVGPQYRSAVFALDAEQRAVAEGYIKLLNESKVFPRPVVTTVELLKPAEFYVAEDYHQDYVKCNPRNRYVQYTALPKVEKVREKFADKVRKEGAGGEQVAGPATAPVEKK